MKNDVIIIGAGPAGCTTAIYTARAGLKTCVFGTIERSNTYRAHVVENFFGRNEALKGANLMTEGKAQAEKFGARFTDKEIVDIKKNSNDLFEIVDGERQKHEARAVVICSGLGFKPTGIKNEQQLTGKGISCCVNCDGFFFKGKKIAVIGNTNFAGEEALQLLTYSPNVTLLSHGNDFKFDPKIKSALDENGIQQLKTSRISEFVGENKLEEILFSDGAKMNFEGAFLALGIASASDFANKLGIMRAGPQNTFIEINSRTGETNVAGVFAAGDCTGGNAQAIKSAGEGCNAGISVIKFLKGLKAYADYC